MIHVLLLPFHSLKIWRRLFYLKGTSEKPATLSALYKTLHPWQMKALTEDTAMAVRTPHDCLYNYANRQILHLYFILCFGFSSLGKIGNSDCENIGGSSESLSSPGNSTSLHLSHVQMKTLQWYTRLISPLSLHGNAQLKLTLTEGCRKPPPLWRCHRTTWMSGIR